VSLFNPRQRSPEAISDTLSTQSQYTKSIQSSHAYPLKPEAFIMPKQDMSKSDAMRVQSTQVSIHSSKCRNLWKLTNKPFQAKNGGDMSANGFAARAQAAGDRLANSNNGNAAHRGSGTFGSGFSAKNSGRNTGSGAQGQK